jgi:hypothetical protein
VGRNWNTYWNRVHKSKIGRLVEECKLINCFGSLNYYSSSTKPEDEEQDFALFDLGLDFDSADDPGKALSDAVRVGHYLAEIGVLEEKHFIPEFSGSKGVAIRLPYQLLGQIPIPALTGFGNHVVCKVIAKRIATETKVTTLDMRIYSKRRQWRLTGTMHPKTGLYRTQLFLRDFERPIDVVRNFSSQICQVEHIDCGRIEPNPTLNSWYREEREKMEGLKAEKARRRSQAISTVSHGEPRLDIASPPPCVAEALAVGITSLGQARGENRNNVSLQLASFAKEAGLDETDAVELLVRHAVNVLAPFSSSGPAEIEASTHSCIRAVYGGDYVFSCEAMRAAGFTCDPTCSIQGVSLGGLRAPPGYIVSVTGVFAVAQDKEKGSKLVRITDRPIWIENRFVSTGGEVRLVLRCGARQFVVDRDAVVIPKRMGERLAGLDLPVDGLNLHALSNFLARFEEVNLGAFPVRKLVTRCGWHGDRFVLPGMGYDLSPGQAASS